MKKLNQGKNIKMRQVKYDITRKQIKRLRLYLNSIDEIVNSISVENAVEIIHHHTLTPSEILSNIILELGFVPSIIPNLKFEKYYLKQHDGLLTFDISYEECGILLSDFKQIKSMIIGIINNRITIIQRIFNRSKEFICYFIDKFISSHT